MAMGGISFGDTRDWLALAQYRDVSKDREKEEKLRQVMGNVYQMMKDPEFKINQADFLDMMKQEGMGPQEVQLIGATLGTFKKIQDMEYEGAKRKGRQTYIENAKKKAKPGSIEFNNLERMENDFPAEPLTSLGAGERLVSQFSGKEVATGPAATPKAPTTRTVKRDGMEVSEEWTGEGWNQVGQNPLDSTIDKTPFHQDRAALIAQQARIQKELDDNRQKQLMIRNGAVPPEWGITTSIEQAGKIVIKRENELNAQLADIQARLGGGSVSPTQPTTRQSAPVPAITQTQSPKGISAQAQGQPKSRVGQPMDIEKVVAGELGSLLGDVPEKPQTIDMAPSKPPQFTTPQSPNTNVGAIGNVPVRQTQGLVKAAKYLASTMGEEKANRAMNGYIKYQGNPEFQLKSLMATLKVPMDVAKSIWQKMKEISDAPNRYPDWQ